MLFNVKENIKIQKKNQIKMSKYSRIKLFLSISSEISAEASAML